MKSKQKMAVRVIYVICGVIFITALALTIWLFLRPTGNVVRITSEGEIFAELDLSTTKNETLEISCSSGKNVIRIENGEIWVSEADCSDQTCVKMGRLGGGMPIVCLPHRLIIEFVGRENDAAVG